MNEKTQLLLLEQGLDKVRNKKRATIILTLILVIMVSIIWFLYGFDYAIGFIIALGIVVFAGMPLYNRYSRQESAILLEMQKMNRDTSGQL